MLMAFLIFPVCWGVLGGLILARVFILPTVFLVAILAASVVVVSIALLSQRKPWLVAALFVCGMSFGSMIWLNAQQTNQYESLIGRAIDIEGVVVARPSITASGNQALVLRPDGFTQYLRVSLFHHTVAKGGERVWIRGQIKQPENFNDFNYVAYLQKNNIFAELTKPKIIIIEPPPRGVQNWLGNLRQQVMRAAAHNLNSESAAIVMGMLIGHKEQLPPAVETAFRKSGLVHILVVSGFNLTIIALGVGVLARWFGRRKIDIAALALIWLFCLLVGATAAVTRAGVMASLMIAARLSGRFAGGTSSLLLATIIMSVINPWQLFYDVGFQLSVAATFGVLEASRLRTWFGREGWLSELLWPSLGAIVCTAPIIAHYFGTFSVVAPLANLLILPLVPYLMLFGALALLPMAKIFFAPLTELIVAWEMKVITFLADWRFSQLEIALHPSIMICYYLAVVMAGFLFRRRTAQLKESERRDTMTKIII